MGLRAHEDDDSQTGKSKWMWGCCGGCLGIGIVAAVGLGVFIYWMVRSQPVVPPEAFFRKDSDALAVIQLRPEHHHLAEFLEKLAEKPPEGINMTEDQKENLEARSGDIPSQLTSVTPLQVVLSARKLENPQSIQEIPEGVQWKFLGDMVKGFGKKKRFATGFAASMKSYGGAMSWTLSGVINSFVDQGGYKEEYEGVDIGVPPDETFYLAGVSNNVLLADDKNVVTGWIDELQKKGNKKAITEQEDSDFTGPETVKSVYQQIEPRAPFIFATSNTKGEIDALLTTFQEALPEDEKGNPTSMPKQIIQALKSSGINSDATKALGGYVDMKDPNTARIHLYAQCDSGEAADKITSDLTQAIQKWPGMGQNEGVKITAEGAMVRTVITIAELERTVRSTLKQQETDNGSHEE